MKRGRFCRGVVINMGLIEVGNVRLYMKTDPNSLYINDKLVGYYYSEDKDHVPETVEMLTNLAELVGSETARNLEVIIQYLRNYLYTMEYDDDSPESFQATDEDVDKIVSDRTYSIYSHERVIPAPPILMERPCMICGTPTGRRLRSGNTVLVVCVAPECNVGFTIEGRQT